MNTDIIKIRDAVLNAHTEAELVSVRFELDNAIRFLRDQKESLDTAFLDYMADNNIHEIWLDKDKIKLIRSKKKTDRYDTPAVYKAIGITDKQAEYLPKNPTFRKTAILADPNTAVAHYEDEKDVLVLKEIDVELMAAMGRGPKQDAE